MRPRAAPVMLASLLVACLGGGTSQTAPTAAASTEAGPSTAPSNAPPKAPTETPVNDCTVRLQPGDDVQAALTAGAVVCLAPGKHLGPLQIRVPVRLRGEPGAILSGEGQGSVIQILEHQITVHLTGLTLTDGYAETGSGLFLDGYAEVVMEDCTLEGNREGTGGGTGVYVGLGHLAARNTTFGPRDDLIITQIGRATLVDCTVKGSAQFTDGAEVEVRGGTIEGPLQVRGTTSRAPKLKLIGTSAPKLVNDADLPGDIQVE